MKKSIIICVVAFVLLLVLLLVLLFGLGLFAGEMEPTDPPKGGTTVPDTTLNNIQEGVDWEDEIDLVPTGGGENVDATDPPSGGDETPTDPPTTGNSEEPTDPPTTDNSHKPTDAPTEEPTQEQIEQTTQDGIDLPLIPG